jgi:hypothetical protein
MRDLDRHEGSRSPRGDHEQTPPAAVALDPARASRLPLLEQDEPPRHGGTRVDELADVVCERLQEACGSVELTGNRILEAALEARALVAGREDVPLAVGRRLDELADLVEESSSGRRRGRLRCGSAGQQPPALGSRGDAGCRA